MDDDKMMMIKISIMITNDRTDNVTAKTTSTVPNISDDNASYEKLKFS